MDGVFLKTIHQNNKEVVLKAVAKNGLTKHSEELLNDKEVVLKAVIDGVDTKRT